LDVRSASDVLLGAAIDGSSDAMPLALAFFLGPLLIGAGALVAAVAVQGWRGRLPRNRGAGIRTPATLASDETWDTAHRAAGPWMAIGSLGSIVPGIIVLFRPSNAFGSTSILVGMGVMVSFVIASGAIGVAAVNHQSRQ
jgi:uncharacterized membrane protein